MRKRKLCGLLAAMLLFTGCGAAGTDGAQSGGADGSGADVQTGADEGGTDAQTGADEGGADVQTGADGSGSDAQTGADEGGADVQTGADENGAGQQDGDTAGEMAPLTDYVSDELYASADQWAGCNDEALAAVMRKAEAGEPVTIACIGGSITQGTISGGSDDAGVGFKKCYADIYFEWWENTFPDTEFTFINAGIGATDSYLGVHRVQKDVLDAQPDLVLVEFSVNDADSVTYKTSYDNLVRRILLADNHPAVMLLFMGQTNGATALGSHVLIGFRYQLPMLSYTSLIQDMMEQNVYTAEQLSGDEVHPSALGHAITGEILWKYLNSVYEQRNELPEPAVFDMEAVTYDCYLNSSILDSETLEPTALGTFAQSTKFQYFPNDWTSEEGEGGIVFEVEFQRLGVLYYRTVDGISGQFDVYIDGERAATLNADFSGGWGNCAEAREIYSSDEVALHTVEFRKSPDSTGETFTILGLMVSQ